MSLPNPNCFWHNDGWRSRFWAQYESAVISLMAVHSSNDEHMPVPNAVEDFWSLESIRINENPSKNDDEVATKLIEKSIRQNKEGRYSVRWP